MTPINYLMPWQISLTVIAATIITAILYIKSPDKPGTFRQLCFWLGLASIYVVLQTRFDYYSQHEFFMHRIQHNVLHHIGPFLIAVSRPNILPVKYYDLKLVKFLNHPVVAPILFCSLIVFWLIPQIHFISMLDWRLYDVMNWVMLINGLMFWNLVLNGKPPPIQRIAMMLAIIPPQIVIGVLIFLASRELYPIYSICGRAFAISAIEDQQIGGLLLWIPAAMMSVIGVLVVMKREWLRPI